MNLHEARATRVAIIQHRPIISNLSRSLEKAISFIEDSIKNKANLIVFGECWLAGYPAWIDYCSDVAIWDNDHVKNAWAMMMDNSLVIPGKETHQLAQMAKQKKVVIALGANEIVKTGKGNGTLYNTFLLFDESGNLAIHHRKLMPTFNEKLLYGLGDGYGLKSSETNAGRIGGLICWEHWMPHSRQALHDSGEDIHIALWPAVKEMNLVASRHYAFEGRCYVIAAGQIQTTADIPEGLGISPSSILPDNLLLNGGSCIIGPDGSLLLPPQYGNEEILYFDLPDKSRLMKEKMTLSVSGHYYRPDVFSFKVNKKRPTDEEG